jgi:hypothetical protein
MKEHFCPAEQSTITYQDKCNWCGESEGSMNEIIEMARQAGFFIIANSPDLFSKLVAFANLVASKEREVCAKVCEEEGLLWGRRYATAIRARGQA